MECNKDEATKAKEIADKKLIEMDLVAAKKFALKAQNLYPELEGLPDLLASLHVYSSAEEKVNGEVDWYGVIGVEASADDDTIRRHYKQMALALHPDKNKSVGADGAFKILSQAWSVLSDKNKKILYDRKRKLNGIYGKMAVGNPSVMTDQNGFPIFTSNPYSNIRDQKIATRPPFQHTPRPSTFWTTCPSCIMQFEYAIMFLRTNLICPSCRRQFLAVKTQPPNVSPTPWTVEDMNSNGRGKNPASAGVSSFDSQKSKTFQSGTYSKPSGVGSVRAPTFSTSQASGVAHLSSEQLKRRFEEVHAAAMGEEALPRKTSASKMGFSSAVGSSKSTLKGDRPKKKRGMGERIFNGDGIEMMKQTSNGNGLFGMGSVSWSQNGRFEAGRAGVAVKSRAKHTKELSQLEIQNMLMQKAKKEICKKTKEWSIDDAVKKSDKSKASYKEVKKETEKMKKKNEKLKVAEEMLGAVEEKDKSKAAKEKKLPKAAEEMLGAVEEKDKSKAAKEKELPKTAENCIIADAEGVECMDDDKKVDTDKISSANSSGDPDMNNSNPMTMSVPDPDFHDFDRERTEKSFGDNQVWAAYDDDDGMPRYYAIIHSVISLKPFKMKMSWLNSKSNTELGPLNWIGSGFYKTCGDFRIGKYEVNGSLNSFSHMVKWSKGAKGAIQIYPVKGDVWALYRNWSPDWDELTPDEVVHKYDMVEVLEDYNEKGVTVAPLVKVAGFKAVFRQQSDAKKILNIPKEEMFRFSHQVPSYKLTRNECRNAPMDCWELDPAALPLELLQVVESKEGEVVVTAEDGRGKDLVGDIQETREEQIMETVEEAVEKVATKKEAKKGGMLVYSRRR